VTVGGGTGPGEWTAPQLVSDVVCALGEGPTWDADAGLVRWVDIDRGVLYEAAVGVDGGVDGAVDGALDGRLDGGLDDSAAAVGPTRTVLTVDGTLGAAVHAEGGGFLLATSRNLEHRDASGATVATWELIPAGQPRRLNDGACDPAGRYVVGSLSLGGAGSDHGDGGAGRDGGDEQLWRLEHDGTVTVLEEGLSLSNGIAWSPNGQVMYHVDTLRHQVSARSYDPSTGEVGTSSVLIDTGEALPDGLAVDSAGDLWIAMWGEGEIRRFAPDGTPRDALRTGVPHNTSCAFVGPELDLLVVTSAASEVPPRGSADVGDADADAGDGRLLAVHPIVAPAVTGLPTRAWRPCANGSPQ